MCCCQDKSVIDSSINKKIAYQVCYLATPLKFMASIGVELITSG